jgi:hypothetical protein
MHHHYSDIRDRAGKPDWWDENGTPRYGEFSPDCSANIYANEIVLLEIACQGCGTRFRVCMSWSWWPGREVTLRSQVEADEIHYGDPPNVGCCPAGPTMNSVPHRVLEFWDKRAACDAVRVAELERAIDCEWA